MATSNFGQALRRLRLAAAMSQETLAERAGLSVRGISDLERGARSAPRPDTVRLLADALALPDDERRAFLLAARPDIAPVESTRVAPSLRAKPRRSSFRVPVPPSEILGRDAECAAAAGMLRDRKTRLLTLTGPGGVGKTRLALAIAEELGDFFRDGVVFVDLSTVSIAAAVPSAIARAMGVTESRSANILDAIVARARERELLLILDNCEHVLAGIHVAAQLLAECPDLSILATSRERLHLRGERESPLDPLAAPEPSNRIVLDRIAEQPAVRLFVARAGESDSRFVLTQDNASDVAEICRRLDGIPLAIELAAAMTRHLSPAALLARLEHRLPALTEGPRDLPDRQRTLHATIAWSHGLLSAGERTVFRRVAVFRGGFDEAAAVAIAAAEPGGSVFGELTALCDKNLLRIAQIDGTSRYTMLETVREFALEELEAHDEASPIRGRHLAYFLNLANMAAQKLLGPEGKASSSLYQSEMSNIDAALQWAEFSRPLDGLRLAADTRAYWWQIGTFSEPRRYLERMTTRPDVQDTPELARGLHTLAWIALGQGDAQTADRVATAALDYGLTASDRKLIAISLDVRGLARTQLGRFAESVDDLEAAVAEFRDVDPAQGLALALSKLATTLEQVDPERSLSIALEAIDINRAIGNQIGLASDLNFLGLHHLIRGRFAEAEDAFSEVLALVRSKDQLLYAKAAANLAALPQVQQDVPRASQLFRESLERFVEMGATGTIIETLDDIAGFAATRHGRDVAQLLGATAALRVAYGIPRPPAFNYLTEQAISDATSTCGERAFKQSYDAGSNLDLNQAVELATQILMQDERRSRPSLDIVPPALYDAGGSPSPISAGAE